LKQLQEKGAVPAKADPVAEKGGTEPSNTKPELSEDLVKSLVEQTLSAREKESVTKQNAETVKKVLTDKYGTEAPNYVKEKAKELNLSVDRLSAIAEESPEAFFRLIGEKDIPVKSLVSGTTNSAAGQFQASAVRDYKYYQELRRKNKALYFDPKTQQQMFKDKLAMGDKFGNS